MRKYGIPKPKPRLPDFDLAPLTSFPRDLFAAKDDGPEKHTHEFILKLAAVFNDIKGTGWITDQLHKAPPPAGNPITPYNGQWTGMNVQLNRLVCGSLYELMNAIRGYLSKTKGGTDTYKKCVAALKPEFLAAWNAVTEVAQTNKDKDESPQGKLHSFLYVVRNHIGFHYDEIGAANQEWMKSDSLGSDAAYASFGESMEKTRFYFADAAFRSYFEARLKEKGLTFSALNDLIYQVNDAVRFLVEEYLWVVSGKPRPQQPRSVVKP